MKRTRRDFLKLIGKVAVVAAGVAVAGPKVALASIEKDKYEPIELPSITYDERWSLVDPKDGVFEYKGDYPYKGHLKSGDLIEISGSQNHNGTYRIGKSTSAGYDIYPGGVGGGMTNAFLGEI